MQTASKWCLSDSSITETNWWQTTDCPRTMFLSNWCVLEWTEDKVQTAPEQCFFHMGVYLSELKTKCRLPQGSVSFTLVCTWVNWRQSADCPRTMFFRKWYTWLEQIKDKLPSAPERCFSKKGILDWKNQRQTEECSRTMFFRKGYTRLKNQRQTADCPRTMFSNRVTLERKQKEITDWSQYTPSLDCHAWDNPNCMYTLSCDIASLG